MHRIKAALAALIALALGLQGAQAAVPLPQGAEHGMVVSAHREASAAGVTVLRQGGNAVDAAVAVAYALAVTFPEAGNIGGGGFMLVRMADGRQAFIDFREMAPGAAHAKMYQDKNGDVIPALSTRGYLAVGVPGTVAGLELALGKYGTMKRKALMAPAIRLASKGFVLDQGDAEMLAEGAEDFAKDAPSAAVFLNRGQHWQAGQRLVQADLGRMLAQIAARGPDAFYKGEAAQRIVA
ncbi:MAG TPA: gamma-glutamyltransferase, partial [Novosphingobium sp.]|nr:gamma-glutamyltransferase [Novosphingobium sp.]